MITGSSGMVGRGVLIECLESKDVEKVLVINRSPIGLSHPKLEEILLKDFLQIESIKGKLAGYDACFYCMGISVIGLSEDEYSKITFKTTQAFADVLHSLNPSLVFCYVSGKNTDSTEKGSLMWARVKGKTENMILNKGFKDAYAFRPGVIIPEKGVKSKTKLYNFFYIIMTPFFPLFKLLSSTTTSSRLRQAMIKAMLQPFDKKILESRDINELAMR